jgi:hypothetical protein
MGVIKSTVRSKINILVKENGNPPVIGPEITLFIRIVESELRTEEKDPRNEIGGSAEGLSEDREDKMEPTVTLGGTEDDGGDATHWIILERFL